MDEFPAVLLTGFNRPECIKENLINLQKIGVSTLYIFIDGPRNNVENDTAKHSEILSVLATADSDFKQFKLRVNKRNMGCRAAMETAITWFFDHEESGAIIEDDCIVNAEFLRYAKILLDKYEHNEQIAHISGSNFHLGKTYTNSSYYFSAIPHIWGWATWRNSWNLYDPDIDLNVLDKMNNYYDNQSDLERYKKEFIKTINGEYNSWGYRWIYTLWKNKALSITPSVNLVSNIGFGPEGTHTTSEDNSLSNLPMGILDLPIRHPPDVSICNKADAQLYRKHYRPKMDLNYLKGRLYPFAEKYLSNVLAKYKKLKG